MYTLLCPVSFLGGGGVVLVFCISTGTGKIKYTGVWIKMEKILPRVFPCPILVVYRTTLWDLKGHKKDASCHFCGFWSPRARVLYIYPSCLYSWDMSMYQNMESCRTKDRNQDLCGDFVGIKIKRGFIPLLKTDDGDMIMMEKVRSAILQYY